MDVGAGSKPSGPYADRMIKGAWPETSPAMALAEHDKWMALHRDADDAWHTRKAIDAQLKQALQSDGFDAMHEAGDKVTDNFRLLAEARLAAANVFKNAADSSDNQRRYMSNTVHLIQKEIAVIEATPGVSDSEKKAAIDALVEETNASLVAMSTAAAAVLTADAAAVLELFNPANFYTSTASSAPTNAPNNGVQALNAGWKQSPISNGNGAGPRQGTGTGGSEVSGQQPAQQGPADKSERPGTTRGGSDVGGQQQPGRQGPADKSERPGTTRGGSDVGGQSQAPPGRLSAPPTGTAGTPVALPSVGGGSGPGGGGFGGGGGSGLGVGGLRGGFPQGLPPSQLSGLPSLAGVPPASAAAAAPPNAASGLGAGGGAPKVSVPAVSPPGVASPASVSSPPAAVQSPAVPSSGPVVTPAGAGSSPPVAVPAASSAPATAAAPGLLGAAPPLAGPPPAPATVTPPSPVVPPPAPATPFHGPPLPIAGAPQISRQGTVERAEDPDIVRARQLVWECLWHGRRYSQLGWAVGLHRGPAGTVFYLTSNEGMPYIPQHVHLPDTPVLTTPFDDRDFVRYQQAVVLAGWLSPVRIVLDHHRLRAQQGLSTLWAVVSSTPADSGDMRRLEHPERVQFVFVDPDTNPLRDPAKALAVPELEPGRRHRLAVEAPELWARLDRVQRPWSAAVDLLGLAVTVTRERGVFTGLVVGGAKVEVIDPHAGLLDSVVARLERREGLDTDAMKALRIASSTAVMHAQRARRTPATISEDTAYLDLYRRARAYEAAVLVAEAVTEHGNAELPTLLLADIVYAVVTAYLPGTADTVADVLRYYT